MRRDDGEFGYCSFAGCFEGMTGAIASGGLGGVERFVGESDEFLGFLFPSEGGCDADADGGGDDGIAVVNDGGCFDDGANALGGDPGVGSVFLRQQDNELFSAVSADHS